MTAPRSLPISSLVLMHVLLVAEIFYSSRLFFAVDPRLQPILLAVPAAICLWACAMLALRFEVLPIIGVAAYVVLLFVELRQFGRSTGFPQNTNALFQHAWSLCIPFFYIILRQGGFPQLLRALILYSFVYLVVYIVIAGTAQIGIQALLGRFLVAKDVERGERVIMHVVCALVLWYWGLEHLKSDRAPALAALGLSALAIYFAHSRVYAACILVLTLMRIAGAHRRIISLFCVTGFLASVGVLCYGVFDSQWNPFDLFRSESSGIARKKAYAIATHFVQSNPFFGVGLAGDPTALGYVVQDDYFAPSDLGPLGVWFSLGAGGLLLFAGLTVVACAYRPRTELTAAENNTFFLLGCTLGLNGIIAPTLIFGAGAYCAIFVACWLDSLFRRSPFRPAPPGPYRTDAIRRKARRGLVSP